MPTISFESGPLKRTFLCAPEHVTPALRELITLATEYHEGQLRVFVYDWQTAASLRRKP